MNKNAYRAISYLIASVIVLTTAYLIDGVFMSRPIMLLIITTAIGLPLSLLLEYMANKRKKEEV